MSYTLFPRGSIEDKLIYHMIYSVVQQIGPWHAYEQWRRRGHLTWCENVLAQFVWSVGTWEVMYGNYLDLGKFLFPVTIRPSKLLTYDVAVNRLVTVSPRHPLCRLRYIKSIGPGKYTLLDKGLRMMQQALKKALSGPTGVLGALDEEIWFGKIQKIQNTWSEEVELLQGATLVRSKDMQTTLKRIQKRGMVPF